MDSTVLPAPPTKRAFLLRPRVLDRIEQLMILLMWGVFAWRMLHAPNAYAPAIMVSETAVMLFTIIRRPTATISLRLGDWLLAMTATIAPLLVIPNADPFPGIAGVALFMIFVGNCWQAWAKLVLRRSFGITPANRGVKISGCYKFMRHPMYAGYLIVHLGALTVMFSPYNLAIYTIGWTAQILRLLAEERLLSRDPAYREYMAKVRWRLIPGVF